MLKARIIPVLLIHDNGLVKTRKFSDSKYVGDPLNAVRIFNEKNVDELIVIDIDATVNGNEPDYTLIKNMASECRMPLCYGGGVKTIEQVKKILGLGVEKVAISSAAFNRPELIREIADQVGSQSVVVVIDAKKKLLSKKYDCYIHNGKTKTKYTAVEFAQIAQKCGAGEILINSIDNDGEMQGYDNDLISSINEELTIPLTVMGGAGNLEHLEQVKKAQGIIGLAAGSLFVFKGKYRAVLINYPNAFEKEKIQNK